MKPTLAITMGDINGIGPEILAKALTRSTTWDVCRPVVIGSAAALEEARRFAPACPPPRAVENLEAATGEQLVPVLEHDVPIPQRRPGQLDPPAGRCAVEWLKLAVRLALANKIHGIVTCPINKEGIQLAGYAYRGHTEVLAEMTGAAHYRMSLFAEGMRVAHVSCHCALAEAIRLVKADRVATTIRLAYDALVRLGIPRRRIAVAGLNPHAGEGGLLGAEESTEIAPAVRQCAGEGIECSGPYPPDTVFRKMRDGEADLVVAMYHDQGHIPLKLVAMDTGVNVTLGIPIIRTSVDHGTAYDIAGTGKAREDSLCAAIALAAQLASKHQA